MVPSPTHIDSGPQERTCTDRLRRRQPETPLIGRSGRLQDSGIPFSPVSDIDGGGDALDVSGGDRAAEALRELIHATGDTRRFHSQELYRTVADLAAVARRAHRAIELVEAGLDHLDGSGRLYHDETRRPAVTGSTHGHLDQARHTIQTAAAALEATHNECSRFYMAEPAKRTLRIVGDNDTGPAS